MTCMLNTPTQVVELLMLVVFIHTLHSLCTPTLLLEREF